MTFFELLRKDDINILDIKNIVFEKQLEMYKTYWTKELDASDFKKIQMGYKACEDLMLMLNLYVDRVVTLEKLIEILENKRTKTYDITYKVIAKEVIILLEYLKEKQDFDELPF